MTIIFTFLTVPLSSRLVEIILEAVSEYTKSLHTFYTAITDQEDQQQQQLPHDRSAALTELVCRTVNNIEHVRQYTNTLPKRLSVVQDGGCAEGKEKPMVGVLYIDEGKRCSR